MNKNKYFLGEVVYDKYGEVGVIQSIYSDSLHNEGITYVVTYSDYEKGVLYLSEEDFKRKKELVNIEERRKLEVISRNIHEYNRILKQLVTNIKQQILPNNIDEYPTHCL